MKKFLASFSEALMAAYSIESDVAVRCITRKEIERAKNYVASVR